MKKVLALGVFDMFHVGHLNYLQEASELGDSLIVGVQDSRAVQAGKGILPTIPTTERMAIVSALKCVSEVFSYTDPDHIKILDHYKPDVLAVGQEFGFDSRFPYQSKTLDYAKDSGIEVKRIARTDGVSSSGLREKTRKFWAAKRPANLTQKFSPAETKFESDCIRGRCPKPSKARILELGCADGRLTKELAKWAEFVVAVDASHSMIEAARKNLADSDGVFLVEREGIDALQTAKHCNIILFSGICPYVPDSYLEQMIWFASEMKPDRILFREPLGIDDLVEVSEQFVPELGCTYSAIYRHPTWIQIQMKKKGWSCYHQSVIKKHHTDTALTLLAFQ